MNRSCNRILLFSLCVIPALNAFEYPAIPAEITASPTKKIEADTAKLYDVFDLSEMRTPNRTATVRNNLHVNGNMSLGTGSRLSADIITAASQEATCIGNNLAVCPCKKLLVNKIQPVQKTVVGESVICTPDRNGVTSFDSHAAVWPDKKFFTNEIDPVKTAEYICFGTSIEKCEADPEGTTKFGGNVAIAESLNANTITASNLTIKDYRCFGQTSPINFIANVPTNTLLITFDDANSIATGALVNVKLFGVITGHNGKESMKFDAFIECAVFVGPSDGTFNQQIVTQPTIRYGHAHPADICNLDISFAAAGDKLKTWINFTFSGPTAKDGFLFDQFIGTVYYEAIGNNIASITYPNEQI